MARPGYDAAGNLTSRAHDGAPSTYTYDNRNLLASETDKTSASDTSPQVTTFTYTPDGLRKTEVKPNGNTVSYAYFADQLLQQQTENTSGGTLVASHAYTYWPDDVKKTDAQQLMNADNTAAYLTHTLAYSYDPRDRITQVQKHGTTTESYAHDANDNVTSQTISGTTTTFNYDRDRLLTAATGGVTADYNYDPLGRLDAVTTGGTVTERNTYDGFDHIVSHQQQNATGGMDTTSYTFDPLDRITSQTTPAKTTDFAYLGLSSDLATESSGGTVTKSYTYTPQDERTSQTTHNSDGTTTPGYYTYNDHGDVEAVTGSSGSTKSTYGYTAYGQPDQSQFTGADKNTASPSAAAQPDNSYRFNAMRWDSSSGQYDMGFRNYAPGLNQFLTRDMYNGALADMGLTADPFTGSRYAFGAGNPITNIELDGHTICDAGFCPTLRQTRQVTRAAARYGSGCPSTEPGCPGYVPRILPLLNDCGACVVLTRLNNALHTPLNVWWEEWRAGWDQKPIVWSQGGATYVAMPQGGVFQLVPLRGSLAVNLANGTMGEMASKARLTSEGLQIQQQVTFKTLSGTRFRIDLYGTEQTGQGFRA